METKDLNPIEKLICKKIGDYAEDRNNIKKNDGEWTHDLKKIIAEIGKEEKYEVCVSGLEGDYHPEWLFDITLYKDLNERLEIGLVVESEWRIEKAEILDDFQKLLVAKADCRLMIFQNSSENIREIISECKRWINNFKYSHKGDRWLFIAYNRDNERNDKGLMIYELYVYGEKL